MPFRPVRTVSIGVLNPFSIGPGHRRRHILRGRVSTVGAMLSLVLSVLGLIPMATAAPALAATTDSASPSPSSSVRDSPYFFHWQCIADGRTDIQWSGYEPDNSHYTLHIAGYSQVDYAVTGTGNPPGYSQSTEADVQVSAQTSRLRAYVIDDTSGQQVDQYSQIPACKVFPASTPTATSTPSATPTPKPAASTPSTTSRLGTLRPTQSEAVASTPSSQRSATPRINTSQTPLPARPQFVTATRNPRTPASRPTNSPPPESAAPASSGRSDQNASEAATNRAARSSSNPLPIGLAILAAIALATATTIRGARSRKSRKGS